MLCKTLKLATFSQKKKPSYQVDMVEEQPCKCFPRELQKDVGVKVTKLVSW